MVKKLPANAEEVRLIPGSGRAPGTGKGNPLQYSCLGKSKDREAWWATKLMGSLRIGHDLATKQQVILRNVAGRYHQLSQQLGGWVLPQVKDLRGATTSFSILTN